MLHQIKTCDLRGSLARGQQRRQHLDERALARAIRSQQPESGTWRASKCQMIDSDERAETARQRENFNCVHVRGIFHGPLKFTCEFTLTRVRMLSYGALS